MDCSNDHSAAIQVLPNEVGRPAVGLPRRDSSWAHRAAKVSRQARRALQARFASVALPIKCARVDPAIRRCRRGQRRRHVCRRATAADACPVSKVLSRRQVGLERRLVADVSHGCVKPRQVFADVATIPSHPALLRPVQCAQRTQQARLACAVGAGDLQNLPGADFEIDAAKHVPIATPHVQPLTSQALLQFDPSRHFAGARVSQIQALMATLLLSASCVAGTFFCRMRAPSARVAELVDARDLKSLGGNPMPVRFRPWAPSISWRAPG